MEHTTLILQLSDGTHRSCTWTRTVPPATLRWTIQDQQRSRLHTVVRALAFFGANAPVELSLTDGGVAS